MKRIYVSLMFLFVFVFAAYSQKTEMGETQAKDSTIQETPVHRLFQENNVIRDSRTDALLNNHMEINKRKNGMDGYRLEIFFSSAYNAKDKAMEVKTEFLKRFPELEAYIQFQSPNFKVRIGNFRTKSEALAVKEQIKKFYPNAFRVDDIIQFPKLITEDTKK